MLTIKRQIPAVSVTRELIQKICFNENRQDAADKILALLNPEPQYETEILQIGQRVKIMGGMKYDTPEPGTICKVVRIEQMLDNEENDKDYIEVQVRVQGVDDFNEFKVSVTPQDVSKYIQLV